MNKGLLIVFTGEGKGKTTLEEEPHANLKIQKQRFIDKDILRIKQRAQPILFSAKK